MKRTKLLTPHHDFIKTLFDLGLSQMDIHRQLIKLKKVKCCTWTTYDFIKTDIRQGAPS